MNYAIEYLSDVIDNKVKLIIDSYWKYENGNFKYECRELSELYEISISQIIDSVKEKSHCIVISNKCKKCRKTSTYKVKTRADFIFIINRFMNTCSDCNEWNVLIDPNQSLKVYTLNKKREYAIKNQIWRELKQIELDVLKSIIKYKSKYLIYRHVFKNNLYDLTIWNIINHLEDLGLIEVIRDQNQKILKFEYLNDLKKIYIN